MLSAEIKFSSYSRRVARQPDIVGVKLRTQATTDADNAVAERLGGAHFARFRKSPYRTPTRKMIISLLRVFRPLLLNIPPFCLGNRRYTYCFPAVRCRIVSDNVNNCDGSVYRVSGFYSTKEGVRRRWESMKMVASSVGKWKQVYIYLWAHLDVPIKI